MRSFYLPLFAMIALGLAQQVDAAQRAKPGKPAASAKKLYKWVGADGKVFYSDQIPPSQVNAAHEEKSNKTGMTTTRVDTALTPEQRAAALTAAEQDKVQAEIEAAKERKISSELSSYANEQLLIDSYQERQAAIDGTLKLLKVNIEKVREAQLDSLSRLAELELSGTKITAKNRDALKVTAYRAQILEHRAMMVRYEQSKIKVAEEQARMLAIYRERKAAESAASTPLVAPAPPIR